MQIEWFDWTIFKAFIWGPGVHNCKPKGVQGKLARGEEVQAIQTSSPDPGLNLS